MLWLGLLVLTSCGDGEVSTGEPGPGGGPGPGTVTAQWPPQAAIDATGVITVEVRALSEFPIDLDPLTRTSRISDSTLQRVVPVYVVPGEVVLVITALPGLVILDDGSEVTTAEEVVTVQRGTVATASWSVRATSVGQSGVIVSGTRLTEANPDEPLSAEVLEMLDLDDMRLTLRLDIEGLATVEPSPSSDGTWRRLLAVLGALGVTLPFVLWLVSRSSLVRRRTPRFAAAVGWLPHRLAEFRNLGNNPTEDPKSPEVGGDQDR